MPASSIMAPALAKDPRCEKGFDPRMWAQPSAQRLTLLLLDANGLGIVSSRLTGRRPACRRHWIERACYADLAFRVLTGNQQPDHSRIRGFRLPNLDALSGLFVQILRLLIVAVGVSNQPPDVEHLGPMLERTIANTGACPTTFIADAGYWSENNAEICTEAQTDPHIATGRQKHGQPPPATTGRIPKDLDLKGRMARKLRTKKGHEIYAKRKTIPEPVFGQTKEARGLRRFLLRGLENVNGEWTMWCTTHNILKFFRFQRAQVAMATR
ncbi:MAG: transposase [Cyanobacteriota bacterium]|nr:transposase [Cyanobacteriota bacterium]